VDHLQRLRIFVAVADSGGFTRVARARSISAPTVTRAVTSLERHLGVLLIQRSTRSLRLTEEGEAFLGDCRRVLADLDAAEATLTNARQELRGTLAISAPAWFGSRYVAPLLFEFLDRHPQLQARALFTNRLVHLIDEGFDVALRIASLPDSRLTAVQVGHMRLVVVASPQYLKRHGVPRQPAEIGQHHAVGFHTEGHDRNSWVFKTKRSRGTPQERLVVNANEVAVAAAVAGHGLVRALAYQVCDEVRDGRLRVVMQQHEPPLVPVHLVYPAGRAAAAKVRGFVNFAAERLRQLPVLQGRGLETPTRSREGRHR